jgi:glycerol uptake facilitator-like aquaporin
VVDLAAQPETGIGAHGFNLSRRLLAEFVGTGFLLVAVVGSGIMATRLTDDVAVQLLANSAATAGALIALILALSTVSGAHLNPVVTLVDRLAGTMRTSEALAYAAAQVIGACVGVAMANVMFELPAIDVSTDVRSSGALWLSEFVATIGLLVVINGCVRGGRADMVAVAVGVWIGGAYWFTSSTSFANPAVTIARTLTDTFAGIAPESAPMFIAMQLLGALTAWALIRYLFADRPAGATSA